MKKKSRIRRTSLPKASLPINRMAVAIAAVAADFYFAGWSFRDAIHRAQDEFVFLEAQP